MNAKPFNAFEMAQVQFDKIAETLGLDQGTKDLLRHPMREYRLQPLFVDDLAELAVREGGGKQNRTIDAIGPETFTYRELVRMIGGIIGKPCPILSVPPAVGYLIGVVMGKLLGDVVITRAEIAGLMADLLCTDSPPAGETKLTDWVRAHADTLGVRYASEMARRTDRASPYENL